MDMNNMFQTLMNEALNNTIRNEHPVINNMQSHASPQIQSQQPVRYLIRSLNIINDLSRSYNNTMTIYNNNIQELLRMVSVNQYLFGVQLNNRQRAQGTPDGPETSNTNTQTASNAMPSNAMPSNAMPNIPLNTGAQIFLSYLFEPLNEDNNEHPLTQEQINSATRSYVCTEQMISDGIPNCPITLNTFVQGDRVCEINGCNHKFTHSALMTWFRRSAKCPVCRFNVRTNRPSSTTQSQTTSHEEDDSDDESLVIPPVD